MTEKKLPRIIAADFDGTLFEDAWPEIGAPKMDVIRALKNEKAMGSKIILWTNRMGQYLYEAIKACAAQGIIFDAVNENLPEVIEAFGGDCRKIVATEFWDDRSVPIDVLKPVEHEIYNSRFRYNAKYTYGAFPEEIKKKIIEDHLADNFRAKLKEFMDIKCSYDPQSGEVSYRASIIFGRIKK